MSGSGEKKGGCSCLQVFALLFVVGTVIAILLPRSNEWLDSPPRGSEGGEVHSATQADVESTSDAEAPRAQ